MAASDESIEALRRDIDKLDDAIHDLLMRRAKLAEEIGAVKRRDGERCGYMRAGREARIMRRLMARHSGAFAYRAVLRIWREIIAATLSVEGSHSVAAAPPPPGWSAALYRDMVRDHFGSCTPLTEAASDEAVIDALVAGRASVGVVPDPRTGEALTWWSTLARLGDDAPRIVARLPFLAPDQGVPGPGVLVLALAEPEPSGDDATLLVVEGRAPLSDADLAARCDGAGLVGVCLVEMPGQDGGGPQHLVELADFVAPDDSRLDLLAAGPDGAGARVTWLGAFPQPLEGAKIGKTAS